MKDNRSFRTAFSACMNTAPIVSLRLGGGFLAALMFLLVAGAQLQAQPQDHFYRAWTQTGGEVSPNFINRIVTVAGSGGAYFSASSVLLTGGGYGMRLIKYASGGTTSWLANFDLGEGGTTHVGGIAIDVSGNVVVTGSAYNGSTNGHDLFVVKYNSSGTKLWHQTYNGAGTGTDAGTSVICNASGDVFVTGVTSQTFWDVDALTLCFASNGTLIWDRAWDNASLFDAGAALSLLGTRVIVTGASQTGLSTWEYAVLRYEQSDGTFVSAAVTDQGGTNIERVSAAATDAEGNIYLTGALGVSGQGFNIKTIKLSAALDILWTASWNGAANLDDAGRGIAVDTAGNVFVAGYTTAANRSGILLKYSPSGSLLFATGDSGSGEGEFTGIALTGTQSAFVCGYTSGHGNRDFLALLYSNDGALRWSDTYNGYANGDDWAQQVTPDGEGNFLVSGISDTTTLSVMYAHHALLLPAGESVNAPLVENRGQLIDTDERPADEVRYYTRSNYPNVYVLDDRVSFAFAHIDTVPATQDTMVRVDLTFASHGFGGGATVAVGLERRNDFHNYYLGHIPEGRERVPLENKVLHPNIYDNVDALYGLGEDGFFLRFVCKPGSSPGHVRMQFVGNSGLTVDSSGALRVETDLEDLLFAPPTAIFVDEEGEETEAGWSPQFMINMDGTVRFTVDSVPGGSTLIVKTGRERYNPESDCNFYWSTYFGEANHETALGNDVNSLNGDMYYCGKTMSPLFPVNQGTAQAAFAGSVDAFVSCFDQPDQRKWGTFYGGTNPAVDFPALDVAYAVKWKQDGNLLYFVGRTTTLDFPILEENRPGEYINNQYFSNDFSEWNSRGFIGKLNAENGKGLWATLFGDPSRKVDGVCALHLSSTGTVVVGGFSTVSGSGSSKFPSTSGSGQHSQATGDAFIAEFGPNNNLLWATKLANENAFLLVNPTTVNDISEDGNGNLLVVGTANYDDLSTPGDYIPFGGGPLTTVQYYDAFIMRFSTSRELLWSRYFGGEYADLPNSIIGLPNGDFYITGTTESEDFPVLAIGNSSDININDVSYNGGNSDIFASKFSSNGTLLWSRYYGGPGNDGQGAITGWEHSTLSVGLGTGNAAYADAGGTLYLTGYVQNGFQPIVGQSTCPYFHDEINEGSGGGNFTTEGSDAWVAVVSPALVTEFSTYWGGSSPGENYDQGNTIVTGITPFNNRHFLLFGGMTNSISIPGQSKPIPLCRESDGPYYITNLINGGPSDAFISKIYVDECLLVNAKEAISNLLAVSPNPAGHFLRVSLSQPVTDMQVFSVTGQNMGGRAAILSSGTLEAVLDVSQLPPGWYLLSAVLKDGGRAVATFIKV